MRHIIICAALAVITPCTYAQSSVTLYGIIDLGVAYTNSSQTSRAGGVPNGGSQFGLADGHTTGLNGSRWGLRGREDLGGGLSAVFDLENGFMANSGALAQGGAEFGRQAWVGLSSDTLGKVTLGRQYDPLVDNLQGFTSFAAFAGYMGSHPDDVDNLSNTNRINNSIKYTTPSLAGFRASALYSFGGVAGSATQSQIWSVAGRYAAGPIAIAAGYLNARDPNVSFFGNTPNKGSASANNLGALGSSSAAESNPVYAGYASAKSLQIFGVGGSLTFGDAVLSAVASNVRFDSLGSSSGPNPLGYAGDAVLTSFDVNGRYHVTPSLQLGVGVDYTRRNSVAGDSGARYVQLDFGADYTLSKHTDIYLATALQHATGRDSLGQQAVASIAGFNPSSTDKQIGVRLGLRHKF